MSSKNSRKLSYSLAINEALHQMMEFDSSVFLIGQGVKSPWYVGNTCNGLIEKYSEKRVIDTPISENAITGAAVGAALSGMRSIAVHPRIDFMMYALDPIINQAANWSYMFGGKVSVPVVIWGIINRGGEQGAQHSQALQALFSHIPGLKVVMPSTPYDAKGLMISAIKDDNPVVYIDDRWLYKIEEMVPEKIYSVPIGKGVIRKRGNDVTIAGISYMASEAVKAANELEKHNISSEVIDMRTVKPLDIDLVLQSIKKTGRLIVTEAAWLTGSVSASIVAEVQNRGFKYLKAPIERICLPDCPAPTSGPLEKEYYINSNDIILKVKKLLYKN
ncbi:MAG: pyruvate dehydrogenase complex E1 component subunit beta [Patescibacteria group bacterium]|nr:pyruvate dehydrogenase complex E1 component subunit beta [Patescibacteria group bacterium]